MLTEIDALPLALFPEYDEEGTPIFRAECRDCGTVLPVSEVREGSCLTCWDYWTLHCQERQALDEAWEGAE